MDPKTRLREALFWAVMAVVIPVGFVLFSLAVLAPFAFIWWAAGLPLV